MGGVLLLVIVQQQGIQIMLRTTQGVQVIVQQLGVQVVLHEQDNGGRRQGLVVLGKLGKLGK